MTDPLPFQFLHPAIAHERACDFHQGFSTASIGEVPRDGFTVPINDPHGARDRILRAWWVAHYHGRPSRGEEEGLALLRAVAYESEDVAMEFLRRRLMEKT